MKDGRTHLAHKAEHAVDLDTGAVVAVTLQGADKGDTTTLDATLCEAGWQWRSRWAGGGVAAHEAPKVNVAGIEEAVTDKGYHSGAVVKRMKAYSVRSYIPEKKRRGGGTGRAKGEEQQAVYANRRRVQGEYGKSLLRRRGELVERSSRTATRRARCGAPSARTGKHLEAATDPRGSVQPESDSAKAAGAGTPREWKNRAGQCFGFFAFLLC